MIHTHYNLEISVSMCVWVIKSINMICLMELSFPLVSLVYFIVLQDILLTYFTSKCAVFVRLQTHRCNFPSKYLAN